MKGVITFILLMLISFVCGLRNANAKCGKGEIRVCGCFSCYCKKLPKCSKGKVPECINKLGMSRCYCVTKKKNTSSEIKE